MSRWFAVNLQDIEALKMPDVPAVYAIYLDGTLFYIGQSVHPITRLNGYEMKFGYGGSVFTPWGQAAQVVIKFRYWKTLGDWLQAEYRLIRRLKPTGNKRGCEDSVKTALV